MIQFLLWYVTLSLLGLLTFPLAYRLFPALADRGYAFARTLGLLLWGYIFWLLASVGVLQNDPGGILLALAVLAGLSVWALSQSMTTEDGPRTMDHGRRTKDDGRSTADSAQASVVRGLSSIVDWLKSNFRIVLTVEILFLASFVLMAVIRAANPEITTAGGEKTMETAFINAIMRSPTFPPHDPWLSGYAISYYYFGYVMTAMLAEVTGVIGSVAHNLMLALIFALSAIGAYGMVFNLLAAFGPADDRRRTTEGGVAASLLGPLFLLIVSNVEGLLEVLHRLGLFWSGKAGDVNFWTQSGRTGDPVATAYNFWTWLDMKELSQAPKLPFAWIPDRFYWWWRGSRILQDYDLNGNWREIIDEFPAFSFLLGDVHPHVLALPFGMLALGMGLNLFLGGWRGETDLFGLRLPIRREGFALGALVLGGLAFLNTWDFPIHMAIFAAAFILMLVREKGWGWGLVEDFFRLTIPLGILGILLYLPFYVGFSSQAGGPVPNLVWPTRGVHLWVMFGTLFVPLFLYFVTLHRNPQAPFSWKRGLTIAFVLILALWAFSWILAWFVIVQSPDLANGFLSMQGVEDSGTLFMQALTKRLYNGAGLLTLFVLLSATLAFVAGSKSAQSQDAARQSVAVPVDSTPTAFVLMLILFGGLLVLTPEFVYLRDQFGSRMNTVFKFYFQAWQLWSLAAAVAVVVTWRGLRGPWRPVYGVSILLVVFVGLIYSVLGVLNKTNNFTPPVWTLDGAVQFNQYSSDDAAAVEWLKGAPYGVVAEAVGGQYSDYGRVAVYSGLPDVLGWPGHESQWRGGDEEMGTREGDMLLLYSTPDWNEALAIIQRYDIRYVYVGNLERDAYPLDERKFQTHMVQAYGQGGVTIYTLP